MSECFIFLLNPLAAMDSRGNSIESFHDAPYHAPTGNIFVTENFRSSGDIDHQVQWSGIY